MEALDPRTARAFADEWLAAWNDHDLERVLRHFADHVVFTSPLAAQLVVGSAGVVRGKAALRDYWQEGLRRGPDLRFEPVDVAVGVRTVVITYRNQHGAVKSEVLVLADGLVVEGHATNRLSD